MSPNPLPEGPACERYKFLAVDREPYLTRAREASRLTIPALIPPEGTNSGRRFYTPFNSVSARGVNNLASKMLLTLLPPNVSFFRFLLGPAQRIEVESQGDEAKKALDEGFAAAETFVNDKINLMRVRPRAYIAFKHLLVGGNALLLRHVNGTKFFPLSQYVVLRDAVGTVLEIVVEEEVSPAAITDRKLRKYIESELNKANSAGDSPNKRNSVKVYTHVKRDGDRWTEHQEVMNKIIPDSEGDYPHDACPWVVLRYEIVDGENYGRGLVEQYLGDIATLEALWQSLSDGALAASKFLYGIKPGSPVKAKDLEKPSGSIITGDLENDVTVLQQEKGSDLSFAAASADKIEKRLEFVFLLNSAIQRDAERVTAEEIRYMANELETALGGTYTVLSQEFQLPLVRLAIKELVADGAMKDLTEMGAEPVIVTGLDALGRNQEQVRLDGVVGSTVEKFGPAALEYLNIGEYLRRSATNMGVDADGLIRSDEDVAASRQQAMQQNMVDKATAPVAGAVAKGVIDGSNSDTGNAGPAQ